MDVNKKATDSTSVSVINIMSINGQDTITNNEIIFSGNDLNIDSIVKAEKAKAMNDLATTSKYDKDCKKPCCKGCMATDTIGLAIACLSDHSCCNPNFK